MFTCSAASTSGIFRGIPALSSALSGDGNNYFLSPFLLSLSPSARQLWSQPLLYDWTMMSNAIVIWRMLHLKNGFKHPVTLQEKGLCGRLFPTAETKLQVTWFVLAGPAEDIIPEVFVPVLVHSLCPPHSPIPKRLPCLSWSCKCPVIWVNFNSKWYSLF